MNTTAILCYDMDSLIQIIVGAAVINSEQALFHKNLLISILAERLFTSRIKPSVI
jgi:hypothetical protein